MASFMESLTQEKDKIVQMGTIKRKEQELVVGVSNSSMGKPKSKNLKLPEKKKNLENPNLVMQVRILLRRTTRRENRMQNAPIATRDGIQIYHA